MVCRSARGLTSAAKSSDARNAIFTVRGGIASPALFTYLRAYRTGTGVGATVGLNVSILDKGRIVKIIQPTAALRRDATVAFRLAGFRPAKGKTYTVNVEANVFSGGGVILKRTLTLIAK